MCDSTALRQQRIVGPSAIEDGAATPEETHALMETEARVQRQPPAGSQDENPILAKTVNALNMNEQGSGQSDPLSTAPQGPWSGGISTRVNLKQGAQRLVALLQSLYDDPCFTQHRHKVGIARPARYDVHV